MVPKLQRLTMDLHCMDNRESLLFSGQFLKPFSELRFLQYLKVDGEAYIQQMHELLHHLPSSLEELELSLAGDFLYDFYETRDVTIPTTNLRRLIFSAPMPWYAILLLKQSPLLEDVTLSTIFQRVPDHFKVLVDHCPRIHSIQFHEAGMLGNSVLPMISEYSELRALSLGLSFYSLNQRLEFIALLGQLTNTLESLRLSCSVFGIGENLGKMLRTFPNLRVVELGVSYPQPRGYGIHLYDLLHDRNKDSQPFTFPTSQHIPWACHSLEVFRCRIDTSFGHVKVVSIEDEAKLIGQFYQELKTLRRLIHLDLAWNQWRQHHGLHMPREVGLQFMIQHGQPEKYRMSKGDLLWMNLHWPSLAEVEEQEAMEKLRHVSENEKSGCKTYQSQYDQDPYGEFAKNPDVEEAERKLRAEKWAEQWCPLDDWPSQANKKVLGKSGKSYIHRPRSSKHQIAMSRPLGEFYSAIKYTPVSFHYVPKSLTINVE
ncbi:hypothetical protein BGX27_010226 [Mortierella sp. AM989]|nr:hypothetical protein BGX27_010226 [Mortierella sp. AM989]